MKQYNYIRKRMLSLLMSVCMIITLVSPVSVAADDAYDDNYYIGAYGGMLSDLTPSTLSSKGGTVKITLTKAPLGDVDLPADGITIKVFDSYWGREAKAVVKTEVTEGDVNKQTATLEIGPNGTGEEKEYVIRYYFDGVHQSSVAGPTIKQYSSSGDANITGTYNEEDGTASLTISRTSEREADFYISLKEDETGDFMEKLCEAEWSQRTDLKYYYNFTVDGLEPGTSYTFYELQASSSGNYESYLWNLWEEYKGELWSTGEYKDKYDDNWMDFWYSEDATNEEDFQAAKEPLSQEDYEAGYLDSVFDKAIVYTVVTPTAPVAEGDISTTTNSITIKNTDSSYEYGLVDLDEGQNFGPEPSTEKIKNNEWKSNSSGGSITFRNLTSGAIYKVAVRKKESGNSSAYRLYSTTIVATRLGNISGGSGEYIMGTVSVKLSSTSSNFSYALVDETTDLSDSQTWMSNRDGDGNTVIDGLTPGKTYTVAIKKAGTSSDGSDDIIVFSSTVAAPILNPLNEDSPGGSGGGSGDPGVDIDVPIEPRDPEDPENPEDPGKGGEEDSGDPAEQETIIETTNFISKINSVTVRSSETDKEYAIVDSYTHKIVKNEWKRGTGEALTFSGLVEGYGYYVLVRAYTDNQSVLYLTEAPGAAYIQTPTDQSKVRYTVIFKADGEDVTSLVSGEGTDYALRASFVVPDVPDSVKMTKDGFAFTGWKDELTGITYKSGAIYTVLGYNVTLTANWQKKVEVKGVVTDEKSDGISDVNVKLLSGSEVIAETDTNADGSFTFRDVPKGRYNLMAYKAGSLRTYVGGDGEEYYVPGSESDKTAAQLVTIEDDEPSLEVKMRDSNLSSKVEVVGSDTPDISVGGLDEQLDKEENVEHAFYTEAEREIVEWGGSVEFTFEAEKINIEDKTARALYEEEIGRIEEELGSNLEIGMLLDLGVEKKVTELEKKDDATTDSVPEMPEALEIIIDLPSDLQGMDEYKIIRIHEGEVDEILPSGSSDSDDLEKMELIEENGTVTGIILYANKFSTYGIVVPGEGNDTDGTEVDKSELRALYDEYEEEKAEDYEEAGWAEFAQALSAAKTVLESTTATQEDVDNAKSALEAAISGLVPSEDNGTDDTTVDKTALRTLYDAYKDKKSSDYKSGWAEFAQALSVAKTVLESETATQQDVDNAKSALETAIGGLALVPATPAVNKTALRTLYNANKDRKAADYKSGWAAFAQALSTAKTVLDNATATQAAVDSAKNALETAAGKLIKKSTKTIAVSKKTQNKICGDKAFTLGATTAAGERLTYTLSNTKVAKVDQTTGRVTIQGCGTVVITIKSAASANYYAAKDVTVTLTVKPKKASISSASSKKSGQLTASWKRDTTVTGYEVYYSTNKNFKNAKKVQVKNNRTTSTTITKGLKKGTKYYVRVRSYTTVGGKTVYGDYSAAKNATVKKK